MVYLFFILCFIFVSSTQYIIFPCYNEAKRFRPLDFEAYLSTHGSIQFIFVNDGSSDETKDVLQRTQNEWKENVELLNLKQNQGKAEAVRLGFLRAMERASINDFIGFWDCDLSTPLSAIDDFVSVLESKASIEMVFGARVKLLGRDIERYKFRHYFGRLFATMTSMVLNLGIYDTQCGAKIFRFSPQLRQVMSDSFHSSWIFDVEIIARYQSLMSEMQNRIYEYPLHEWFDIPGSKLKPHKYAKGGYDLMVVWSRYVSPWRKYNSKLLNDEKSEL